MEREFKNWITADWHLGEDRFKLMQRFGFADAQDMVDQFVEFHNALVQPGDNLYFVGDACNQNTPGFLEQVRRFNGRKILFRGNHDRVFSDKELLEYFAEIVPEGDGREVWVKGPDAPDGNPGPDIRCWITHYPTQSKEGSFNLVGHIHGAWKVQLNALNVGVDVNHYRPHNFDDIAFYFKAINDVYDEDVWLAYHPSQETHQFKRGKRGRYLDVAGKVGGRK